MAGLNRLPPKNPRSSARDTDEDNVTLLPPKKDAHVLGYLDPAGLYQEVTDSFYETPDHCYSNPNHVFPESFRSTLFPVTKEGTTLGGPNTDYITMSLAAGLLVEPDVDPMADTDYRELMGGPSSYTPRTEAELAEQWQTELCCRTTIMSTPKIPGIVSPKKKLLLLSKAPDQPVNHQELMNQLESVTGSVFYPAAIQCSRRTDHLENYAHDFLCVPLIIGTKEVPEYETHRI
jgi:hypothetical protein